MPFIDDSKHCALCDLPTKKAGLGILFQLKKDIL